MEMLTDARLGTMRQSTVRTDVVQDALESSRSLGRYERVQISDSVWWGCLSQEWASKEESARYALHEGHSEATSCVQEKILITLVQSRYKGTGKLREIYSK